MGNHSPSVMCNNYGYGYDEYEEDEEDIGNSGANHTLEEVLQESIQLKRMIDLDGSLIARDISIEVENIVHEEPFARDPDKEDFEGYTGNAGASATHFYHDTVRGLRIRGFFDGEYISNNRTGRHPGAINLF